MLKSRIAKDTITLTALSLGLQGLSLLLNIFVTMRLGTAGVGLTALVYSFYSFFSVIASGNVFVCVSRFVSEETGKSDGNPHRIFVYAVISCTFISVTTAAFVFLLAPSLSLRFLKTPGAVSAIRILALALIPTSIGSCVRGLFNARRKIIPGAIAGVAEFLVKAGVLAFFIHFLVLTGKTDIFVAVAVSVCAGEICGALIMLCALVAEKSRDEGKCSLSFGKYLLISVPVVFNSYITVLLSSLNEALIPLTLRRSGSSSAEALGQYGVFEAIVLPLLFFPSSFIGCMSSIIMPELSRASANGNAARVKYLTQGAVNLTVRYSFFAAAWLWLFSDELGRIMCEQSIAGRAIAALAPVVPFIYLEIVLEGVIRGLGRPGFSTVNYIAEYAIRITVLLVCVPLFGFNGIVLSYFLSNSICNISRFRIAARLTGLRLGFFSELLFPAAVCMLSLRIAETVTLAFSAVPVKMAVTALTGGLIYLFLLRAFGIGRENGSENGRLIVQKYTKSNI